MPKKYFYFLIYFAVKVNFLYSQKAIPTIQTDRPDMTETPFLVPHKYFQIETGWSYEKINYNEEAYVHPNALIKYGFNENLELRLVTELETQKNNTSTSFSLNPILIGLKVKLWEEKGIIPKASLITHLSIPFISTTKPINKYYAPSFRFTLQHNLSNKIYLGYNLGAQWEQETRNPTFLYTLVSGTSISEKIGTYLEFYGYAPTNETVNHNIASGFTFLLKPNLLLDLSGGFGLTKNASKHYIALGISARLPK